MACLACNHRQREALEEDLAKSETPNWRVLRHAYGIHHLALMRHKREHMKPAAYRPAVSSGDQGVRDSQLKRIVEDTEPTAYTTVNISRSTPMFPMRGASVDLEAMLSDQPQREDPLRQFKHAWGLAKDDRTMQQQMIDWLNQQLQADDMGLP